MPRTLGIMMVGGRGDGLQPLMRARSKAALPFGARHRIVDARLVRAVIDRYNRIPPRTRLAPDAGEGEGLSVHRDPSGIVVVPRGESLGPLPLAS